MRAPNERDFSVYANFYQDPEASHFYGGPLRPDKAWKRLAADLGHWHLRGYGLWALERRSNGEMVGCCGLWWATGWPRRELTWWLSEAARGAGLATEASRAAIKHGYDTLGWDMVETHMDDENVAARKLTERLGGEIITRESFPDGRDRDVFKLPRG
jgi:ribosomal-protein-alanine N-acetyltransferase